jgi:hypothetical protein
MQPILAESAPHRSRAMAIAIVFTAVASLATAVALFPRAPSHRGFHRHGGKCPYVYVVR